MATLSRTDVGVWSILGAGTNPFSTGSFTPPANSILIIHIARQGWGLSGDLGALDISGGSLTYNAVGSVRHDSPWNIKMDVYAAVVGGSPSSMTITVDDTNNDSILSYVVSVIAFTGYRQSVPTAGWVSSGDNVNIGDGAEELTLAATPTANDVTLLATISDADGSPANPTLTTGWTLVHDHPNGGSAGTLSVARRENSTSTSVAVTDIYTYDSGWYKACMVSFFVQAESAVRFARPEADISTGNWTATPLWEKLDDD